MKKYAITALFAVGVVSTAHAQIYGELGYLGMTVKKSGVQTTPNAIRATLGYEVNPNLAVETMVAIGTGSKRVRVGGGTVQVKLSNSFGLYAKPKLQLSEQVEVYSRLGISQSSFNLSANDASEKESSGAKLSYGIGARFKVTPRVSINADYMHYFKTDESRGNGFAIGVGYTF